MSSLLQQLDIFELRPLITNLSCKLSAVSEYDVHKQLLCLVSEENDIVLRYTSEGGQEVLKLISWFRRTNRVIHDICFDPTGTWLLVLCFDNTLHIVPALAVVDRSNMSEQQQQQQPSGSASYPQQQPQQPYSTTQVTSYIIPFVGPHECPNSKKCPNHNTTAAHKYTKAAATTVSLDEPQQQQAEQQKELQQVTEQLEKISVNQQPLEPAEPPAEMSLKSPPPADDMLPSVPEEAEDLEPTMAAFSHDVPASMLAQPSATGLLPSQALDQSGNSQVMSSSFMVSKCCPYPISVVWWQTMDGVNRAIIGYSDGSICFVALSPNCPFVASTAIESGSVVKLLLCRDNTYESVMLLITSSLKQQFKLLLEQKAIKYTYPGDISPTGNQAREGDWQIVMPLKPSNPNNSNSSDPASDSSQLDEDVFVRNDEAASTSTAAAAPLTNSSTMLAAGRAHALRGGVGPAYQSGYTNSSQLPPPPPYSVAINRHQRAGELAPCSATSCAPGASSGVRFQQQQLPMDEYYGSSSAAGGSGANSGAGILPAARARLASLRSLGTKKLNAIKMRLSDNRHKLEEYMPENSLGSSFAIMDSPSLTPEILGVNSHGSFYTIQNLRNTYLLSALHCQSNSLSVHNIDINLKPLFLYKIPDNCFDILISSNLLYSIQYVDLKEHKVRHSKADSLPMVAETNTEKENRDTALEQKEKNAEEPLAELADLSVDDVDQLLTGDTSAKETEAATGSSGGSSRADTSATTSEPSTNSSMTPSNLVNAVGVMSSAMASLRTGDVDKFNVGAQLGLFRFENETVLNLYQMATYRVPSESSASITKEEKAKAFAYQHIHSPIDYVQFYEQSPDVQAEYSLRQMEIMQNEFPKINYDPCYVVTNKNVYYIQLKKDPFAIFLDAALAGEWVQCREFCNTFDLAYEACIEFAGDFLLRRKKVTQALLTYNTARIKPIRTALKLAMFGQTNALMHLCAMALKSTYILKSQHFCHPILKSILADITYRHSEDVRGVLPPTPASYGTQQVNEGDCCSDYSYSTDDAISNLQMSPSSQFHLANLLLITLAEKAVNDKNYLPLWNFLCINTKYHTNMTSIVLCQSGLFSAALVLAKTRGVCIDTFLALTSVVGQEFGWYSELNVCLYNLSEDIFTETITYVPHVAVDYFAFIQEKLEHVRPCVLQRLEAQLNPFSPTLRPIVSHTSAGRLEHNLNDNNSHLFDFCKNLIETYLAVLIHMESQRSCCEHITYALSTFRISYEDNQFAIESSRFKPISAGCVHCACIVDGVAYFWGSNGVPCNYSVNKSSDPPEPPHAVKGLELLSQLNLEVHAVKCGRQHTLVLTNNGLYTFGSNTFSQLGIGKVMQMSLQPMLVSEFDGKNITILEAGQYHNAAVADGLLYTWGWGVYGQLGHGDTEDIAVPKPVKFFKNKKVIQVSLGHAHSLVLCQEQKDNAPSTELYVFGSNHFGQLGLGSPSNPNAGATPIDEEWNCATLLKSVLPLRLSVSTAKIRLIHTKFFTNLAVDENERMYTWGSSPQALRLANQIRRRANAKQKIEEHQRREMSKRLEVTFMPQVARADDSDAASAETTETVTVAAETTTDTTTTTTVMLESEAPAPEVFSVPDDLNLVSSTTTLTTEKTIVDATLSGVTLENVADDLVQLPRVDALATVDVAITEEVENIVNFVVDSSPAMAKPTEPEADDVLDAKKIDFSQPKPAPAETDICQHMVPTQVDTSEVAGQILQISSGLFHFALISSSCTLYTWGKNLEHQLGTEDKERRAVHKPSPIDSIERPMYVDCGADFTLVMTTDFVVKAFGGNSNGQCGRDLGPSIDKAKQRVVCLPTTKRLMRFESQCVEVPVEINLPRPRIRLDNEPVRYLKSIPRFQAHFMQEANINFGDAAACERPSPSQQYKSSTHGEDSSAENAMTGQDSDDLVSSLENLSNNEDGSSLNVSLNAQRQLEVQQKTAAETGYSCCCGTAEEQEHLLPPANTADDNTDEPSALAAGDVAEIAAELQQLRHYIHYCLYVFHGLYNPDKVRDFAPESRHEYRIRTLMLNFKFVDAFTQCLQACDDTHKALRLFEYFSKDTTGCVPMRRQDMKYLIYYLLLHFLAHKFDMFEAERYFLADLDYYLLELAYVLYFNNNNTALEQNLNQKFKTLMAQDSTSGLSDDVSGGSEAQQQQQQQGEHKLEDTDVIFDSISVKFKTIVCQRLLQHCSN